jgi:hypothetical protein
MNDEQRQRARELLKEVEINNGHLAIAYRLGMTQEEVAQTHEELLKEQEKETEKETI